MFWSGVLADKTNDISVWSRLLPYLEQSALCAGYTATSTEDQTLPDGTPIMAIRIPAYICPSEINDMAKLNTDGSLNSYPGTYGVNLGPWLVFDPTRQNPSLGSFYVNSRLRRSRLYRWSEQYANGHGSESMEPLFQRLDDRHGDGAGQSQRCLCPGGHGQTGTKPD